MALRWPWCIGTHHTINVQLILQLELPARIRASMESSRWTTDIRTTLRIAGLATSHSTMETGHTTTNAMAPARLGNAIVMKESTPFIWSGYAGKFTFFPLVTDADVVEIGDGISPVCLT